MKHLLKLGGMTPEEILHILDVADEYKRLLFLAAMYVPMVSAHGNTCPPL